MNTVCVVMCANNDTTKSYCVRAFYSPHAARRFAGRLALANYLACKRINNNRNEKERVTSKMREHDPQWSPICCRTIQYYVKILVLE